MKKANSLIALGIALPAITDSLSKGSQNKDEEIKVIRVEKRLSKYFDKHHMRMMSLGREHLYKPKVVGATITLEGPNPQDLRTYIKVNKILQAEAKKLRLFAPAFRLMNLYQSHEKANMWNAKWIT